MHIRVALALVSVLVAVAADGADAAPPKPPSHAAAGQSFKVPAAGRKKVSYYLSRDTRRSIDDVRLIGPRKSQVVVPAAPTGTYHLLACTGARCAASRSQVAIAGGKPTQIIAFGDSRKLDDTDQNIASNAGLTPALCPPPVPPRRLPSTSGALDAAHELLARAAGPKGMAEFKASPAYRSAAAAEGAAVEAVAVREPGAALAALLRAHDLEPDEPRYLVGAAAILTSLDHPAEALALIDGADRISPSRSAPFGINVQALALNAKGAALLALGQFADAERYLRAAIEIEPLLSEAKINLSIALMCGHKQTDAMRFLRAGLLRQATIAPDGSISAPPIEDQIDISHGQHATVPTIPIPATFMAMKGSVPMYKALGDAYFARLQAMTGRDSELYKVNFGNPSLLSQQRVLGLIQFAFFQPDLIAAQDAMLKVATDTHTKVLNLLDQMGKASLDWQKAASVACANIYTEPQRSSCMDRVYNENCTQPLETAHQQIVDWVRAQEKADRDYIDKFYPWETAVMANISNPLVQEHWLLQVEMAVDHTWQEPLMSLSYYAVWARNQRCGTSAGDQSAPVEALTTPSPEPCPPSVRGVKLAWKVEAFSLEVNCEKVSVEASATVEGWFGVFGQLDWSPRSGKTTIFAGPKVSAKIPGTSLGGSFKDGLYLQIGKDGYVGDFGFRTSVSGSAGFGPFSIKGSDSMDFSFAPVFGIDR
jgi:tetratricopeptide (TPR) repeat protein